MGSVSMYEFDDYVETEYQSVTVQILLLVVSRMPAFHVFGLSGKRLFLWLCFLVCGDCYNYVAEHVDCLDGEHSLKRKTAYICVGCLSSFRGFRPTPSL